MWRTAKPLPLLVYVALITTLVDTVQRRVNYKSSRSSVIHTKHENGEMKLMGSLPVLRSSHVDSRQCK